jgi:hypothetical protein
MIVLTVDQICINEYHILAFDPGGTIGWARLVVDFKAFSRPENKVLRYLKHWHCGEFTGTEPEQIEHALYLMRRSCISMPFNARSDVVSEDFELTQLIGGNNLLSPVRINAILDWKAKEYGTRMHLQKRSMRTVVTPDKLQTFGFVNPLKRNGEWSTTGKGKDAFAAMQHAIVWLRRTKERSRCWPWKLGDNISTNAYWDCACTGGKYCDLTHT